MKTGEPRKQHIQTEYLEQIRSIISQWIARNAYKNSLITITKCELSEYGGRITVYTSVFPEHGMTGALSMLTRHGADIAEYIQQQQRNRRKPFLTFRPDVSAYQQ